MSTEIKTITGRCQSKEKEIQAIIDKLRDNALFYKKEDAPEDDTESRWSREELHSDFNELYYALMEIEAITSK